MSNQKINRILLWLYALPTVVFLWHFSNHLKADMQHVDEQAKKVVPRKVRCRDKICEGDQLPLISPGKAVLKINHAWYLVPEKYKIKRDTNRLAFFWPGKEPFLKFSEKLPKDIQSVHPASLNNMAQIGFYTQDDETFHDMHDMMLNEEKWGYIVEKEKIGQGLERWRASDGDKHEDWYFFTEINGDEIKPYPAIVCENGQNYCFGRFSWAPPARFSIVINKDNALHWEEIYIEAEKIAREVEKIQP